MQIWRVSRRTSDTGRTRARPPRADRPRPALRDERLNLLGGEPNAIAPRPAHPVALVVPRKAAVAASTLRIELHPREAVDRPPLNDACHIVQRPRADGVALEEVVHGFER